MAQGQCASGCPQPGEHRPYDDDGTHRCTRQNCCYWNGYWTRGWWCPQRIIKAGTSSYTQGWVDARGCRPIARPSGCDGCALSVVTTPEWRSTAKLDPEFSWSWPRMVNELERAARSAARDTCCDEMILNYAYSTFLENLKKYRLPPHTCEACGIGEGVFEDGVHMIVRMLPRRKREWTLWWYQQIRGYLQGKCIHAGRKFLKAVTAAMKQGGSFITPNWRDLCYWEMNLGYVPPRDLQQLRGDADEWLLVRRRIGSAINEDLYCSLVYREAVQIMHEEWKLPDTVIPVEDWIREGKWMRGKSGTGGTTHVTIDGNKKRTRRMKGVEAALHTDIEIREDLFSTSAEKMVVMQKCESGKVRAVVKTGNNVIRKMDYISETLERGFYDSTVSTLFAGGDGNEKIDHEILATVRNTRLWKVPLDQGGFDQHQSKNTILDDWMLDDSSISISSLRSAT